jgi:ABC-2 type transport system permease protein
MTAALLPYRAVLAARFRVLLQYRAAAAAGLATQIFWGFIRVMIFTAFYQATTAQQPMTLEEVVNYVWLGQALILLLPFQVDADIKSMVNSGGVAYELLRPVDLYNLWYTRAIAIRCAPTLLRAVPLLACATLFFGLRLPPSPVAAVGWLVVMLGAVLLSAALTNLMNISLLWTVSGEGVSRLMPTVAYLFSGMILPLPLYPDWAQAVLDFLPFRGLGDVPHRVYFGHLSASEIPYLFAHQMIWTTAFVLLGRWLLRRAAHRLVLQGG